MITAVVITLLTFSSLSSADTQTQGKVSLNIEAESGVSAWKLKAIDSTVRHFLQDIKHIDPTLSIKGQLSHDKLLLTSFDTQTFSMVDSTSINLNSATSLEELRARVFHLAKNNQVENISAPKKHEFLEYLIFGLFFGILSTALLTAGPRALKLLRLNHSYLKFSFALFIFGFIAFTMAQSIRYHSIYSKRIREIKYKIEEQKHLERERSNGAR